jgi:tRNA (uracil-5-)-methyltransferase TRM9
MNEGKPSPTLIKKGIQEVFDAIAEDYSRTRTRPWPTTKEFLDTIPEGSVVLDLGCGPGQNSVELVKRGVSVVGTDLSRRQLNEAHRRMEKERGSWWNPIQADIVTLPLRDGAADAVLMIAALHHVPTEGERNRALMEVHRCLRSGGRALISVWAFDQPRFQTILEEHREGRYEGGGFGDVWVPWKVPDREDGVHRRFYHLFVEGELEKAVETTPLKVEKVSSDGSNHFITVER